VLVVGAGALGNEVCKNLVLSGFRHLTLVDPDHVVPANRNRCLFFSPEDARTRRKKAPAVAEKLAALDPEAEVETRVQRIQDCQEGLIPRHHLVLGCLDNIQARLHVNAHAYHHRVPYIDGGTRGTRGKVQVVIPPQTSCLECGMNATHRRAGSLRYSCTGRETAFFSPKLAADITITSIIAAIQVQEALKVVHGRRRHLLRHLLYYHGDRNRARVMEVPVNPHCPHHRHHQQ
ncbi:MAG: ThiF family adenylyltransferase, partial [Thermoplasmatota archaeon]